MAQVLRDYAYPLHSKVGEDVVLTCSITLPFPVNPDFNKDVIRSEGEILLDFRHLNNDSRLLRKSLLSEILDGTKCKIHSTRRIARVQVKVFPSLRVKK